MAVLQSVTFNVTKRSRRLMTPRGNIYIECDTDKGRIAVWGSSFNQANIVKIENAALPCKLISDKYVNPSWNQHTYWIPETAVVRVE